MSMQDIGFWVGVGATVVAALYAGLSYHRPQKPRMSRRPSPAPTSWRPAAVVVTLVLIAWIGVGFDYYDRRYLGMPAGIPPDPLKSENARIEVSGWHPVRPINGDRSNLVVNVSVVNKGSTASRGMVHAGFLMPSNGTIDDNKINAVFAYFNSQIRPFKVGENQIQPGDDNVWYSIGTDIGGLPIKADNISEYKYLYVFNIIKYKDAFTPSGKAIYSEGCIYFDGPLMRICGPGHTMIFISDDLSP